jgi:hypothetical protein
MDEIKTSAPESPALDAGKWIGRVVIAVILAEGIWGLIVSVTNNLVLPLLARIMGADAQSPLYLGKGDFNVPALFTAVLELCFAGIAGAVLNSWVQRNPRPTRSKSARVSPIPTQAAASRPSSPPAQATASVPLPANAPLPALKAASLAAASSPVEAAPPPGQFWSPPELSSQPKAAAPSSPANAPAKPAKPKPTKEVYYNIVGEPINPTEEE